MYSIVIALYVTILNSNNKTVRTGPCAIYKVEKQFDSNAGEVLFSPVLFGFDSFNCRRWGSAFRDGLNWQL